MKNVNTVLNKTLVTFHSVFFFSSICCCIGVFLSLNRGFVLCMRCTEKGLFHSSRLSLWLQMTPTSIFRLIRSRSYQPDLIMKVHSVTHGPESEPLTESLAERYPLLEWKRCFFLLRLISMKEKNISKASRTFRISRKTETMQQFCNPIFFSPAKRFYQSDTGFFRRNFNEFCLWHHCTSKTNVFVTYKN